MDREEIIEMKRTQDGDTFVYEEVKTKGGPSWVTKLKFWSLVVGGIAFGTVLFLFFITVFVYLFVPLLLIALAWAGIKYLISK